MNIIFLSIIILSGIILGFFILIQSPKGSGLSGSIVGGLDNNFFGVQKTTNILERGTWLFAIIIGLLCLFSSVILLKDSPNESNLLQEINTETSDPVQNQPFIPKK